MNKLIRIFKQARSFYLDSTNPKSFIRVGVELILWFWLNDKVLIEYFFLGLHKKGNSMKNFLARKEFHKIHNLLNPKYYRAILEDKFVFDKYISDKGLPIQKVVGYIENNTVFLSNNQLTYTVDQLPGHELNCFCKLNTGCGGANVFKLDIENSIIRINNKTSNLSELRVMLGTGVFVLQQTIKQHPKMSLLNNESVNSLRIYTISSGANQNYFGGFLRIGQGKSVVDNTAMGNLTCPWNNAGELTDMAFEFLPNRKYHQKHPDTNIEFKGFQIPYFNQATQLVEELHQHFPFFFIIAWDIAIAEDGITVIEANPLADLAFLQAYYGGQRKQFKEYANSFANYKKLNIYF